MSTLWSALFSRVKRIPHDDPELTPDTWCRVQPCRKVHIASKEFMLSQPLSTCWVYGLGLLTIGVGLYFLYAQQNELSRFWWGMGLLLWGIGALLAGTSYQAFGYEIKCAGRAVGAWTSWWELIYLICQQVSMNMLLAAVAYSCTTGALQEVLLGYAWLSALVYGVLVFIGGIVPLKALITFEFMVWWSAPGVLGCMVLNAGRFLLHGNRMDLALLSVWGLLVLIMAAYRIYDARGIAKTLWARRLWFSENDVLHVLLILWMLYIAVVVAPHIQDYS